jgi:hypothetical protein
MLRIAGFHPARTARQNAVRMRRPGTARLYTSEVFRRFIAACFGLPRLYELADPLAGLCLNVITPGRGHPWHFDTNGFTVSMLAQTGDSGGEFGYCPDIRSAEEENLDAVDAVLTGADHTPVRRLAFAPSVLATSSTSGFRCAEPAFALPTVMLPAAGFE